MNSNSVAAIILMLVGILCIFYAIYRTAALEQSMMPLVPVGLMCTVFGLMLLIRSSKKP